jgi:hypothetical protein
MWVVFYDKRYLPGTILSGIVFSIFLLFSLHDAFVFLFGVVFGGLSITTAPR